MKRRSWVSADKLLVFSVVAVLLLALLLGNPYSAAWWLKCPLFQLTGFQCPLCGMQRQLHALMHFQWGEAWRLNPVLLLGYPYLGLLLLGQLSPRFRASRVGEWCYRDAVILTFVGVLLVWGVVRNL